MYPEELTWPVDERVLPTHRCAAALLHAAAAELADALRMIEHCLGQLSDEQIWQRLAPEANAVANLVLHLAGNLRQWAVCGLGGDVDERQRSEEFSARGGLGKAELLARLRECVDRVRSSVLPRLTAEDLLRLRRIQGFEVSGMAALWHTVAHFRGHAQEIIGLTRAMLGPLYVFAWKPRTAAEGA